MSRNSKNISDVNRTVIDLVQDPLFTLIGKDNLSSYWNDTIKSCLGFFTCQLNLTDGWITKASSCLQQIEQERKSGHGFLAMKLK